MIDAATHRFLTDLRRFDEGGGWHLAGTLSCAHWLSWRCGMDLGTAREKVRVARRLGELPLVDAALRTGAVSYSKVRAISRVANGDSEEALLGMARETTAAQLEKICRLTRQVQAADRGESEGSKESDDRRWVSSRATDDGMVSIRLRLRPEEAARVMRALEASAEAAGGDLADGAVAMADGVLSGTGGDDPVRPAVEVVVRVSAEDLSGETGLGDGISAEVSRRVLCDAGVVPVLQDGAGRIVDVGRKRRTISAALRRALAARDGGCRFPGCSNRRHVDGHHVRHWVHGGETSLENCLQLCRRHHVYVHEGGFRVELVDGEAQFFDPTGRRISEVGERPVVGADLLESWLGDEGVEVTAETNAPGWDGTPIDYGLCVAAAAT